MSLRTRILSLTVGATTVVLLLFAVPLWVLEHRAAASDVEQSAVEAARGVADYVSAGATGDSLEAYVDRIDAREDSVQVAVIEHDGTTYGPSLPGADQNAQAPLPGDADGDRDGSGFLPTSGVDVDRVSGGRLVRIGVTTDDGRRVVLAYVTDHQVTSKVTARLLPLGAAALLLLLLVGG
ncbi:MAG: hypothetical protein ABIO16_09460, partial [Nocardioides sp.]